MWWFLNLTGFPFDFKHRYGNFNHTRVLFQIGEGYAAIQMAGGLPVEFKYVMASEPYT
jgi:hypothetical protein